MIYFRFPPNFPKHLYPIGLLRQLIATFIFFDHISFRNARLNINGGQSKLIEYRNKYKNKKCIILANGPSLTQIIYDELDKSAFILGCNGIGNIIDLNKRPLDFYFTEDIDQVVVRRNELNKVKSLEKFCALHNSFAFNSKNFKKFYAPVRKHMIPHDEYEPSFSKDFAGKVHLGYTIVYIMLQFAYFAGFNEVEIYGLNHDYGKLPDHFPPGKITIDKNNISLVRECHGSKDYYKVGDVIGIPFSKNQEKAFQLAKNIFESDNRTITNKTINSKLNIFKFE